MPTLVYETAGRFFVRHSVYGGTCSQHIQCTLLPVQQPRYGLFRP